MRVSLGFAFWAFLWLNAVAGAVHMYGWLPQEVTTAVITVCAGSALGLVVHFTGHVLESWRRDVSIVHITLGFDCQLELDGDRVEQIRVFFAGGLRGFQVATLLFVAVVFTDGMLRWFLLGIGTAVCWVSVLQARRDDRRCRETLGG